MTRTARALVLCCYGLIGAAWLLPSSEPRPALRTEMTVTAPKPAIPASVAKCPGYYAAPTFTPEDLWAYTITRDKPLPPLEYDHPFQGAVTVIEAKSQNEVKGLCNLVSVEAPVFGCAFPRDRLARTIKPDCVIILGDAATIARWGWTRNIVLRHETGHCNGWKNHEGAR